MADPVGAIIFFGSLVLAVHFGLWDWLSKAPARFFNFIWQSMG
ncbi:hypothetical protein [Tsuneonella rigui]|jgi:hypothetical protein|nr:hypothetical protein [Tsuneonella rigui]